MLASVALALAVEDAGGLPLSDLEYGDCYLCAVFCLASDLRGTPDAATNALEEWRQRLDEHVDYLVFGAKDSLDDLTESGWERFLRYHDHPDAILPQAYLHLLSQAVRHRRGGSATPYADLDPMVQSEPLVVAALEQAWETKAHVFATIGTASSTSCATPPRSMTASSGRSRRATSTKDAR